MYNWFLENNLFHTGDAILGTNFINSLKHWRITSTENADALKNLQLKNLKNLLTYIGKENNYYKQFLPSLTDIGKADPVSVLKSLPLLDKADIRANFDHLISVPFKDRKYRLMEEASSGSSGIQGKVLMSRSEAFAANAAQTHLWEWSGYKLGSPLLQLGMTLNRGYIKCLKDFFNRTTYMPAFKINKKEVYNALHKFQKKPYSVFGGYASGLYSYACLAEAENLDIRFMAVISWGDKMFPHYRKKIETVFQTKVFDVYGCSEGIIIAGQCQHGSYHILTPHVYLELLDEKGHDVKPGEIGNVVVTRLDGRSFPLVRYKLGDLAIALEENQKCQCGMQYPLLAMIIGRDTDIVYSPSGKALIVHFFTAIFEHELDIKQFKVIQREDETILVEYISDLNDPSSVLNRLEEKINQRCGEKLPISFLRVQSIAPTKSGKPQIIASYARNRVAINV